jgi:ubiquinone/menaquinone biosynthesis C-methylase UbiE
LDIEIFLKEKLPAVHRAWYALWIHWWPWWRKMHSGPMIQRKWRQFDLVAPGQSFLDYGCGTGCFTLPAARIVGETGRVYALDCFPRQLEVVKKRAGKAKLNNIETILSDAKTGLPDESIDIVWMCDVFHEIEQRRAVLEELHRVLRRDGVLVIYDGMRERVLNYASGLFSLSERDDKLLKFVKKV